MTASLATSRLTLEHPAHKDMVTKMQVVCIGNEMYVYTSSRDRTIKRWKVASTADGGAHLQITRLYEGHGYHVNSFAVDTERGYMVSGGSDKMVRLWDIETKNKTDMKGHTREVLCVGVDYAQGKYILSGGRDGKIMVSNTKGERKRELSAERGHLSWITDLITNPSKEESVITASEDGSIIEWNLQTGELVKKLDGHEQAVIALSISPDGSLCASAGLDRRIYLWDLKNIGMKCEIKLEEQINCIQFALSAYWLAAGTDSSIIVWDIFNKEVIAEIPHEDGEKKKSPCTALCWANGFTLFAGYQDGTVRAYTFNVA